MRQHMTEVENGCSLML